MNARIASSVAAAALALLGTSAAFAQQAPQGDGYDATPAVVSTQSRSAVRAEVAEARAAGQLGAVSDTYGVREPGQAQAVVSTTTRAEVKAGVLAARQRGERLDNGEAG